MTDNKITAANKPNESTKENNDNGKNETSIQGPSASITFADEKSDTAKPKATATNTDKKKITKPMQKSTTKVASRVDTTKTKISKTALFSLLLVIIAIAGVIGSYIKTQRQFELFKSELASQNEQGFKTQQAQLMQQSQLVQQLRNKQNTIDTQVTAQINTIKQSNNEKVAQLKKVVERFSQSQPSDWLIHEAEYLIRIAARSVWLNNDTKAAVNLLSEADNKFKQLNSPQYLPIRQLIRQDIATLNTMPTLAIEDTVLSLIALNKQVAELPLAFVHKEAVVTEKMEPTADIADWQANLKITWDTFVDDYFTLRPINANIQPLLNPLQQQNLRQNLSLKIQLAIWAATEKKPELYQQTLTDIELWLSQYFDMEQLINISFNKNIVMLKAVLIYFDYSVELNSLNAVRKMLERKPLQQLIEPTLEPVIPIEEKIEKPLKSNAPVESKQSSLENESPLVNSEENA